MFLNTLFQRKLQGAKEFEYNLQDLHLSDQDRIFKREGAKTHIMPGSNGTNYPASQNTEIQVVVYIMFPGKINPPAPPSLGRNAY